MGEVREQDLRRPDGRAVAWTTHGPPDGTPLLRIPGTPGSRWSIREDRTPWDERNLFAITTERPGFGRSTRLPGRGFAEHADDLAAILDHHGLDRVHVIGGSGAAPHILAFCGRHPDRVRAATILVGITPLEPDEVELMIPTNAASFAAAAAGDREGVMEVLRPIQAAVLEDPLVAFQGIMETAPEDDRAILADPSFQASFVRSQVEAHAQGPDGWVDEAMAIGGRWEDVDLAAVEAAITWYHAAGDRNCPISAARRVVDQLAHVRFVEWPAEVGHLHGFHHEAEILDELLARG